MSQAALLSAVRDALQGAFDLDADSCEVGFDGQPKPSAGELYIAVHPLSWEGISSDYDLGESYSFGVTISMKAGVAPQDRYGIALWADPQTGLDERCRLAIRILHQSQTLRGAANGKLASYGGGAYFMTAPQVLRVEPPRLRDYSWFSAAPPEGDDAPTSAGVSQTITFGKVERVVDIQDME